MEISHCQPNSPFSESTFPPSQGFPRSSPAPAGTSWAQRRKKECLSCRMESKQQQRWVRPGIWGHRSETLHVAAVCSEDASVFPAFHACRFLKAEVYTKQVEANKTTSTRLPAVCGEVLQTSSIHTSLFIKSHGLNHFKSVKICQSSALLR